MSLLGLLVRRVAVGACGAPANAPSRAGPPSPAHGDEPAEQATDTRASSAGDTTARDTEPESRP